MSGSMVELEQAKRIRSLESENTRLKLTLRDRDGQIVKLNSALDTLRNWKPEGVQ